MASTNPTVEVPEPHASSSCMLSLVSSGSTDSRSAESCSRLSRGTSPSTQDSSRSGSDGKTSPRKFKPELVETSTRHGGRDSIPNEALQCKPTDIESPETGPRRFVPQLIEVSKQIRSVRTSSTDADKPARRVFVPLLVESTRRSRRAGDTKPALTPADRTDVVPSQAQCILRKKRVPCREVPHPPSTTPFTSSVLSTTEARRLGIPIPRRTLSASSSHSRIVKTPALETIDSSESDRSDPGSPSSSHSLSPIATRSVPRLTDHVVPKSPSRLLETAARNAERQLHLREQALAAFPNDDRHQPVHHYVDLKETPAGSSFSSQYEIEEVERHFSENWELKEIRQHHEHLEATREQERKKREARRRLRQHLDEHPWDMPVSLQERDQAVRLDSEMPSEEAQEARTRSRPPMLGGDLVFPRSSSPDAARFDVTQGPDCLKKAMCYLSEQSESSCGGLWSPKKSEAGSTCIWSRPASRAPSAGGLWGGQCIDTGHSPSRGPTGIVTPRFEEENHSFSRELHNALFKPQLPPSPPPSMNGLTSLEERLESEVQIENEFDDEFVTQVYNYMSLGYPAVARDFDEELSKVTRVPIDELRQDDNLPSSRGYIRLGEDSEIAYGVTEENCTRWKALRLYILEWAHQQPNMTKPREGEPTWGRARKGSWAL